MNKINQIKYGIHTAHPKPSSAQSAPQRTQPLADKQTPNTKDETRSLQGATQLIFGQDRAVSTARHPFTHTSRLEQSGKTLLLEKKRTDGLLAGLEPATSRPAVIRAELYATALQNTSFKSMKTTNIKT